MQGAAVEPGDQERAILGQRAVDINRGQAFCPRANSEANPPRVLALDCQEAVGDRDRIACGRPRQKL
jgi:hypothetical protein